jgi:WhiB family redox-sensing transcriptional regulator
VHNAKVNNLTDLLAELAAASVKLPGALCKHRSELFDIELPRNHPNRRNMERKAVRLCRQCPALRACQTWLATLAPSERPQGVVAGVVLPAWQR